MANEESMVKLDGCVNTILEILEFYGLEATPSQILKLREKTLLYWSTLLTPEINWMKLQKYKLAAFLAYWSGNQLPEKPSQEGSWSTDDAKVMIGGLAARFIQSKYRKCSTPEDNENFQGMVYSMAQGKKGMPRASKDMINAAVAKTVDTLCNPTKVEKTRSLAVDWADVSKEMRNIPLGLTDENLILQIKRTVIELFGKKNGKRLDINKVLPQEPYMPSFNATYSQSRSGLGQFGALEETNFFEFFKNDPIELEQVENERRINEPEQIRTKIRAQLDKDLHTEAYDNVKIEQRIR